MTANEQELQRSGFIKAFRSTAIYNAIAKGSFGRIAVVYVEWGGVDDQLVLVPWTVIDGPEAGWSFATKLSHKPIRQAGMTSISGAITFSRKLFADLKEEPARRVIDISGDGPNNDGAKVIYARDHAVAEGITLNGLPITIKGPGSVWDIADLDAYYTDCVIGGPGSFMIPLHHADQFPTVIQAKILREIAGIDTSSLVHSTRAGADCLSGEKRRTEEEALGGEGSP